MDDQKLREEINRLCSFYRDMLAGNTVKELVKVLLEKAGYTVFPYGYESTLSDVKNKMRKKGTKNSRTVRRIRSSPDLLVHDDEKKDLMLVEVKMRRAPKETYVVLYTDPLKIRHLKEFWDDSILVLVVPCGNIFYAQRMSELEIRPKYDLNTDFERFEEFFPRTKAIGLSYFKGKALEIMEK